MLHFFSAHNELVNTTKAMSRCIGEALPTEDQQNACDVLMIHTTIGHDFPTLLSTARELCPNAEIVGCSCAGVIGYDGAHETMRAVAIMAIIADDPSEVIVSHTDQITGMSSYDQSRRMAEDMRERSSGVNMLYFLASGIDIACDRALEGIESVFGPETPIFGGTSSDNFKAITSFQFYGEEIYEHGALLIGFADPTLRVVMGVHHGSVPIGRGFKVTSCDNNRIYELDGQPAWHRLMDALGFPHDQHPGPCIPVAGIGERLSDELIDEYDNEHILRVIVKTEEDGSFYVPVSCQEGATIWLTKRDEELIFDGLRRMLNRLKTQIAVDEEVVAVFQADCAARGRAMFDQINKDEIISIMHDGVMQRPGTPWLGFYGYGEFCLLGGRNTFHNYTTSLFAIVRS